MAQHHFVSMAGRNLPMAGAGILSPAPISPSASVRAASTSFRSGVREQPGGDLASVLPRGLAGPWQGVARAVDARAFAAPALAQWAARPAERGSVDDAAGARVGPLATA